MDARIFEAELHGVDIGDRRLAAGDVDRVVCPLRYVVRAFMELGSRAR